ncbi:MAG: GspE/PulE family protein, partial [Campylobacterota bacterium]|nr:GspE/PulE family protein [Campylobacterota bacterium]
MVNLIETMLKEKLITKEAISALVKSRPPKKISFVNLVREKMIELKTLERFLVKKIKQKTITLVDLEKIDGIDIVPIMMEIADDMGVEYIDLDEIEIDMKLFSKVPHRQLMKYNVIPVEENEFHVLVAFDDPDDMSAQDAVQRLFPRKPINVAIAIPKQIKQHLQRLEISESIEGLITEIRDDLSQ